MKKGYIVSIYKEIFDQKTLQEYAKIAKPALESAGGKFIARGNPFTIFEEGLALRTVIIEFENVEKAVTAYKSPEYTKALNILGKSALRDIRIMEGEE